MQKTTLKYVLYALTIHVESIHGDQLKYLLRFPPLRKEAQSP